MLIRTFFMLAMICALATAMVHTTASLARADIHRRANIAADAAFAAAIFNFSLNAATAIASGSDPRTLPTITPPASPTCASTNTAGNCEFTATITTTSTTTQQVGISPESSSTCAPLCAINAQENDAVSEGRIAAHIIVTITGGSGSNGSIGNGPLFATRNRYAIFRTIRILPYVTLIGIRDATTDTISTNSQEGDDTGMPSLTTINVVYKNANTGASMPGNAWQSRAWNDANAGIGNWEP